MVAGVITFTFQANIKSYFFITTMVTFRHFTIRVRDRASIAVQTLGSGTTVPTRSREKVASFIRRRRGLLFFL